MATESGVLSAHATLGAGTADTVRLTGQGIGGRVRIIHHGNVSNPIYVRGDGTAAVAAADENRVILPGGWRIVSGNMIDVDASTKRVEVSLISAGAATYSVEAL